MVGRDTDVGDSDELLLVTHPQVSVKRSEAQEDEAQRNAVAVSVDDRSFRIDIRLPAALLKVDAQSMRGAVAEDFVLGELASDKNHGESESGNQSEKSIEPRAAAETFPLSGSAAFFGVERWVLGRYRTLSNV